MSVDRMVRLRRDQYWLGGVTGVMMTVAALSRATAVLDSLT